MCIRSVGCTADCGAGLVLVLSGGSWQAGAWGLSTSGCKEEGTMVVRLELFGLMIKRVGIRFDADFRGRKGSRVTVDEVE